MLKTACGPEGSFQAGLTYAVSDELAKQLIQGKAAKPLEAVKIEKAEPKIEVAKEPTPKAETATQPAAPAKRGKYRPKKAAE